MQFCWFGLEKNGKTSQWLKNLLMATNGYDCHSPLGKRIFITIVQASSSKYYQFEKVLAKVSNVEVCKNFSIDI